MVTSCLELLDIINQLTLSGEYYFRGYQKKNELISSLGRNSCDGFKALKDFASALYAHAFSNQSFRQILELAQHYGVPTNLIDLTTDPFVAIFFGLGKVPRSGRFSIIYAKKSLFDAQYASKIRACPVTVGIIDNMTFADLDTLYLSQIDELSEETVLSQAYLESSLFKAMYEQFFDVQRDFTLVPYDKSLHTSLNVRQIRQKGLFVFSREPEKEIPLNFFERFDVNLNPTESNELMKILESKKYYSETLLPHSINDINVVDIAQCIVTSCMKAT